MSKSRLIRVLFGNAVNLNLFRYRSIAVAGPHIFIFAQKTSGAMLLCPVPLPLFSVPVPPARPVAFSSACHASPLQYCWTPRPLSLFTPYDYTNRNLCIKCLWWEPHSGYRRTTKKAKTGVIEIFMSATPCMATGKRFTLLDDNDDIWHSIRSKSPRSCGSISAWQKNSMYININTTTNDWDEHTPPA